MAKTNSYDYRDGGLEFAKRIGIHLSGGSLTQASFEAELAAWQSVPYEGTKTVEQIRTEAAASNAAQIREMVKAFNTVAPAVEAMNQALASVGLRAVSKD